MTLLPDDVAEIAAHYGDDVFKRRLLEDVAQRCTRTYSDVPMTTRSSASRMHETINDLLIEAQHSSAYPARLPYDKVPDADVRNLLARQYRAARWNVTDNGTELEIKPR
jgi:hypothetical protein